MQQLFERARSAFRGGRYSYAIDLLRTMLTQEPGCADIRRVLHAVYREIHASDGLLKRCLSRVKTAYPLWLTVPKLYRQEKYPELLQTLEDLLQRGSSPSATLGWLAKVAETCGLPETGTVAVESLVVACPKSPAAWRTYVDHCSKHDLHKRALHGLRELAKLRPYDVKIQSELRQVTAADTVAEGHWDEMETYRDNLRDEDKAKRLEDERRPEAATSEESLAALIASARADVSHLPTVDNRRRLGDLLRRAGDVEGALQQYEAASADSNQMDPALDDAITACLRAMAEAEILRWRKYARENEGRAHLAEERIRQIEEKRDASLLVRFEQRVKRFPLDSRYQAELGDVYLGLQRFDEALRCYQAARRSPAHTFRAGLGAGRSLLGKGLHDLAEREFHACLELVPKRDDERRLEVLYELFRLCQGRGQEDDALAYLKEIYAVDASYRDVGPLLDEHVRQRDAEGTPKQSADGENPA
jgi:tetratricopeptide (TPR) repeat protein